MPKHKLRPIRFEGNVAYVPLTRGLVTVIDADDAHLIGRWNWHASLNDGHFYARRAEWLGDKSSIHLMHRAILPVPAGLMVDHIDGDGLNNRRENLRIATNAENGRNRRLQKNNTSGFKGVCWNNRNQKWQAGIQFKGKSCHLGLFDTPEEAHAAYLEAANRVFGQFARAS